MEKSTEDIRSLAQQVYEAINHRDATALRGLFHPKVVRHAMGEIGIEGGIEMMNRAFGKFPDTRYEVEDVIVEDNRAAVRVSIHGRHTAPGKPLPVILEIFRFEDSQIVEVWGAGISPEKYPG